ncbi:hypothetical protein GW17_00020364 [Ensete ventricosum]|nr:hypothetical protein GW17_00020364 [Ensete ventricosum]
MLRPVDASTTTLQPFSSHHPLLLLLHSCKTPDRIKKAHAKMITAGLFLRQQAPRAPPPSAAVTAPPASLLSYAYLVFCHSPSPPLFSYNTLIKAHSPSASLLLFRSMLRDSSAPDQYTFALLLKRGLEANVFVSNVVIRVCGSFGSVHDAQRVFDGSARRDLFSLIGGYVGCGDVDRPRKSFDEMPEKDVVAWEYYYCGICAGKKLAVLMRSARVVVLEKPLNTDVRVVFYVTTGMLTSFDFPAICRWAAC